MSFLGIIIGALFLCRFVELGMSKYHAKRAASKYHAKRAASKPRAIVRIKRESLPQPLGSWHVPCNPVGGEERVEEWHVSCM